MNLRDTSAVRERLMIAALNPIPNPNAQLLKDAAVEIRALRNDLGRAKREIRASHVFKAELGGGPCCCEWCEDPA